MAEQNGDEALANYAWWQRTGAEWRDEVRRRKRHRLPYHVEEVFLAEYLARQAPARVLEFGCGFGRHLRYLDAVAGLEVHGFDQSPTLAELIGSWASPEWVRERITVGAPRGPLPYPDAHFDVVFTVSVLIHNRPEHLDGVLRELIRICRGHLLLVENVHVEETDVSSLEHDGCWRHPLERRFEALGFTCEALHRGFPEHDVYRVRIDPSRPIADLNPVTLDNLFRMQEELGEALHTPEGQLTVRLAEMSADRDRLFEEARQGHAAYEAAWNALEQSKRDLLRAQTEMGALGAERDRLVAAIEQRDAEVAHLADRVRWVTTELDRVVNSRTFRAAQRVVSSAPAGLARRAAWMVKDRIEPVVKVRSTGRRSPGATATEVWLLESGAARVMSADGHWRQETLAGRGLVWVAAGEGTLVLDASSGPPALKLRGHEAGGIAEVRFRGRRRAVDLFRRDEEIVEVDVRRGTVTRPAPSHGGAPADPALEEALARFRSSGAEHLAIVPPNWLGVGTATRVMFGHVVPVPELSDEPAVERWAGVLLDSGARKLVLGGFARGWERLVVALKGRRPDLRIYGTWHGNAAQHHEEYCRWGFHTLNALAEQGHVTCVGYSKVGLDESLRHVGYPVRTLLLWSPPAAEWTATPIDDGLLHVGLFTAGSGWRKNVHTQITAAALLERHALHAKLTYPDELDWCRVVGANVVERFDGHIPEDEFRRLIGRMHANLYVTFAENGPLFPLESLGVGTVAIMGPTGHLFRDHAYLRERLIVPYPDDPAMIASYVRRAVEERARILDAYRAFCGEYVPQAERAVREFLAVE